MENFKNVEQNYFEIKNLNLLNDSEVKTIFPQW